MGSPPPWCHFRISFRDLIQLSISPAHAHTVSCNPPAPQTVSTSQRYVARGQSRISVWATSTAISSVPIDRDMAEMIRVRVTTYARDAEALKKRGRTTWWVPTWSPCNRIQGTTMPTEGHARRYLAARRIGAWVQMFCVLALVYYGVARMTCDAHPVCRAPEETSWFGWMTPGFVQEGMAWVMGGAEARPCIAAGAAGFFGPCLSAWTLHCFHGGIPVLLIVSTLGPVLLIVKA